MPSQSSSIPLPGTSVAAGLIAAFVSSQSKSEFQPSPSKSIITAIPSQFSSTVLFGISVAPGLIFES